VFSRLEISVLQESDQNISAPISGMFLLSWIICGGIFQGIFYFAPPKESGWAICVAPTV
jgi:hypothetical protein